ncbi:MAG: hypothetical protein SVR94_11740, partial [Pseudomonadota bacterium]|nr:hypothetical protein [Pseudomonadota bacterium]
CLLDGLEKISPAFNVFAHYWISRFQGDNPNKCVNEPIIIEVAEAKQSWEKLLVPSKKYENKRQKVHGIMLFLSALADSSEQRLTGRSLKIGYKKICKELWQQLEIEAKDIPSALNIVKDEMRKMNIHWPFHEASSLIQCEGYQEIKLVVTNCTIRCTLFRYGFLLGTALCQIRHSLFCGIFENVYGAKAELDIFKHGEKNSGAGENACLLNLKIYD